MGVISDGGVISVEYHLIGSAEPTKLATTGPGLAFINRGQLSICPGINHSAINIP